MRTANSFNFMFLVTLFFLLFGCGSQQKQEPIGNPVAPEMQEISAGHFLMGDSTGERNEKPAHVVFIDRPFFIGKYEIMQSEWKSVMVSNPSHFQGDNLPVENISMNDAMTFCNKLSVKLGLKPVYSMNYGNSEVFNACDTSANGYRLPTEAEWEFACRAGTSTDFSGGNLTISDKSSCSEKDAVLDKFGWYCANSGERTHPVGQKTANTLGLFDMHGNVAEWVLAYSGAYPADTVRNPGAGIIAQHTTSGIRGGSWFQSAEKARSSARLNVSAAMNNTLTERKLDYVGLRVVRNK